MADDSVIDLARARRERKKQTALGEPVGMIRTDDFLAYDFHENDVALTDGDRPVVVLLERSLLRGVTMTAEDARSLAAALIEAASCAETIFDGEEQ